MYRYASQLMGSSALGMLVAFCPAAAAAQEAETATPLKPVVISNETEGEQSASRNETTVDAEQLKRDKTSKLDDILRSIAGVFTRVNAQQPGVAVNIRGFEGSGRVNMSIDGARQNFRFTGHEAGGFTYVDPNLLAGIDVLRGAVTTTGGGALAGTVNFRTLDVDDILYGDKKWGGMARLSWGSNGVGFSEMLSGAARTDKVGVIAAVSKRDSNNYKNGDGDYVAHSGQDLTSGLFKVNYSNNDDQTLSLGGVFYTNDFYANSYYQTLDNRTVTAKYHFDPDSELIDLRINGYYNETKMEYTGGTGSYVGRVIRDQGVGFDVSNVSLVDFGDVAVKSVNGIEFFHDDVTAEDGGVNPADGTSYSGGVFSENSFSYGRFDLTGGLRYNFYSLEGSGYLNSEYYDVDISEGSVDPKFTVAVNATDWLQPYVTWSRSMRAPTLQETMLGGSHPGSSSTSSYAPNPDLEPETQQGWDLGVNFHRQGVLRAGDRLTARANYFIMDVDNYIAARYSSSLGKYQYVNIEGTTRVQGVELEANYDNDFMFAGISYTHTDSDLPSQQPGLGASQYMPDDVVSVTGGAKFLQQKLTVGAKYSYVSGGLVSDFSGTASQDGDPYSLVDVFSTYKFNERVDLTLKVTNLFNESYTPFLSTNGTGQGRTFYIATQVSF